MDLYVYSFFLKVDSKELWFYFSSRLMRAFEFIHTFYELNKLII